MPILEPVSLQAAARSLPADWVTALGARSMWSIRMPYYFRPGSREQAVTFRTGWVRITVSAKSLSLKADNAHLRMHGLWVQTSSSKSSRSALIAFSRKSSLDRSCLSSNIPIRLSVTWGFAV